MSPKHPDADPKRRKPRRTFRVYEAEYMDEGYVAKVRAISARAAILYVERHEDAYSDGLTELVAIQTKRGKR